MITTARRRFAIVVAVGTVAATAVGGAALGWQLSDGGTDDESSAVGEYDDAGVPWWDGRKVHWAGHSAPEDDVASYTATSDAGVFLHDRPQYPEQPGPPGLGTLTALFTDGTTAQLGTRVVGVPMADPTGHVVAWTEKVDDDTALVSAYDTARRVALGTQSIEAEETALNVVSAVIGDTVYFSNDRRVLAWRPLELNSNPQEVDGMDPRSTAVIGGTDDGLLVVGEQFGLTWLGSDGSREPVDASPGSLSPDGRYLISGTDNEDNYDHVIVSVPGGDLVDLGIPNDRQIYQARWVSDSTLVAATVEKGRGWDDGLDVVSYACTPADRECRKLVGGPVVVGFLALFEDNFLGQFLVFFESSGLN